MPGGGGGGRAGEAEHGGEWGPVGTVHLPSAPAPSFWVEMQVHSLSVCVLVWWCVCVGVGALPGHVGNPVGTFVGPSTPLVSIFHVSPLHSWP